MSSLDQYVSASKIQERFGISSSSLRRWDRDGTINTIRTPGGFRLYKTSDVEQVFNQRETNKFPNQNQKEILKKWFGTVRWTYNQCLTEVEENGTPRTKKDLRAKCVNADQFKNQDQWVLETPYDGKHS